MIFQSCIESYRFLSIYIINDNKNILTYKDKYLYIKVNKSYFTIISENPSFSIYLWYILSLSIVYDLTLSSKRIVSFQPVCKICCIRTNYPRLTTFISSIPLTIKESLRIVNENRL